MRHLPKIIYSTITHAKQRYNTSGDYYFEGGTLNIRVSKTAANHEFLILIHELIEWYLTAQKGVSIETIDAFDKTFEKNRKPGNTDEPGDDPNAPYFKEHQFATYIEEQIATELGVNWDKYTQNVNRL